MKSFFNLAQNLNQIRDPLVRLTLTPEVDNRKREAIIARGEHHPYFDQHFKFPVSRDQLAGISLLIYSNVNNVIANHQNMRVNLFL